MSVSAALVLTGCLLFLVWLRIRLDVAIVAALGVEGAVSVGRDVNQMNDIFRPVVRGLRVIRNIRFRAVWFSTQERENLDRHQIGRPSLLELVELWAAGVFIAAVVFAIGHLFTVLQIHSNNLPLRQFGTGFSWIDVAVLAGLVGSGVWGMLRGGLRQFVATTGWFIAFACANTFATLLAPHLPGNIADELKLLLAYMVLFIGVLVLFTLLQVLVATWIQRPRGGPSLGALSGVLQGMVVAAVLLVVLQLTPLAQSQLWERSLIVEFASSLDLHLAASAK